MRMCIVTLMLIVLNCINSFALRIESQAKYTNDTLYYQISIFNNSKDAVFIQIENWETYGDFVDGRYFTSQQNDNWMFFNNVELHNTLRESNCEFIEYTSPSVERLPKFYKLKSRDQMKIIAKCYNPFETKCVDYSNYKLLTYIKYLTQKNFDKAIALENGLSSELLTSPVPNNTIYLTKLHSYYYQGDILSEKDESILNEERESESYKIKQSQMNKFRKLFKYIKTNTSINKE